jgi:GAF domain-containing protein
MSSYEIERINALHKLNVLDTERDEDFDQITAMVASIFDAPISFVSMVDKERLFFKSGYGTDVKEIDRTDSFCSMAIEQETPLIVENASNDERFSQAPLVKGEPHFKFYAGVPLLTEQGYPVGTLCFVDTKVRKTLTIKETTKLQELSRLTMRMLELKAEHSAFDARAMLPTEEIAIKQLSDMINNVH